MTGLVSFLLAIHVLVTAALVYYCVWLVQHQYMKWNMHPWLVVLPKIRTWSVHCLMQVQMRCRGQSKMGSSQV